MDEVDFMKHTPGPWIAERSPANRNRWMVWKPESWKGKGSASICETSNWLSTDPHEEVMANARLIAKAPEMYETLVRGAELCSKGHGQDWALEAQVLLKKIDND